MSEFTTIARPYAKAAFEHAQDQHLVEHWANLLQIMAQAMEEPKFRQLVANTYSESQLIKIFSSICEQCWDKKAENFLRLVIENNRLAALPEIYNLFLHFVDEENKVTKVQVVSAAELSEAQKDKITKAMEIRLASKVKLENTIDESIIAGVIIKTDDFIIDGSSRGQITRLAEALRV